MRLLFRDQNNGHPIRTQPQSIQGENAVNFKTTVAYQKRIVAPKTNFVFTRIRIYNRCCLYSIHVDFFVHLSQNCWYNEIVHVHLLIKPEHEWVDSIGL